MENSFLHRGKEETLKLTRSSNKENLIKRRQEYFAIETYHGIFTILSVSNIVRKQLRGGEALQTPACLHISTLYEGKPVIIAWPEVPGAEEYIVERQLGESFAAPATWLNIEQDSLAWNSVEIRSFRWLELESYAAILEVYRGKNGTVCTSNKDFTWFDAACAFPTMGELDAKNAAWQELEAVCGIGYCWRDTEFTFPFWGDLNDEELDWDTLESLSCDFLMESGHIACTDILPLETKTVSYRVRACESSQQSDWFTCGDIAALPRLQREEPISFQIPALYEDEPATISWSPVQEAERYRLEARFNQGFDMPDIGLTWLDVSERLAVWNELEWQGIAWKEMEALAPGSVLYDGPETSYIHLLPIGATTVDYRVTAYNELENTMFSHSGQQIVIPQLLHRDKAILPIRSGESFYIQLMGCGVKRYPPYQRTVHYQPADLKLVGFAMQTGKNYAHAAKISGTNLELVSHENGEINFVCDKPIADSQEWSGLVTLLEFTGLRDGETQVELR